MSQYLQELGQRARRTAVFTLDDLVEGLSFLTPDQSWEALFHLDCRSTAPVALQCVVQVAFGGMSWSDLQHRFDAMLPVYLDAEAQLFLGAAREEGLL